MPIIDIPLMSMPSEREANVEKDARFVNCFPEMIVPGTDKDPAQYMLLSRPGMKHSQLLSLTPGVNANWRGEFVDTAFGDTSLYMASDSSLYRNGVPIPDVQGNTSTLFTDHLDVIEQTGESIALGNVANPSMCVITPLTTAPHLGITSTESVYVVLFDGTTNHLRLYYAGPSTRYDAPEPFNWVEVGVPLHLPDAEQVALATLSPDLSVNNAIDFGIPNKFYVADSGTGTIKVYSLVNGLFQLDENFNISIPNMGRPSVAACLTRMSDSFLSDLVLFFIDDVEKQLRLFRLHINGDILSSEELPVPEGHNYPSANNFSLASFHYRIPPWGTWVAFLDDFTKTLRMYGATTLDSGDVVMNYYSSTATVIPNIDGNIAVASTEGYIFIADSGGAKIRKYEFVNSASNFIARGTPITIDNMGSPAMATIRSSYEEEGDIWGIYSYSERYAVFIDSSNSKLTTYNNDQNISYNKGGQVSVNNVSDRPTIGVLSDTSIVFADGNHPDNGEGQGIIQSYTLVNGRVLPEGTSLVLQDNTGNVFLTVLSSTSIAYIDDRYRQLTMARYSGGTWAIDGTPASTGLTGVYDVSMATMTSSTIAYIDEQNKQLKTFTFSGDTWNQVGSALTISGAGNISITALNSTNVALLDSDNKELRVYRWASNTWNLVGTSLNIEGVTNPTITSKNGNSIILIDEGQQELRSYTLSDGEWEQDAATFDVAPMGAATGIGMLSSTDVAFIDDLHKSVHFYRFYEGGREISEVVFNTESSVLSTIGDISYMKTVASDGAAIYVITKDNNPSGRVVVPVIPTGMVANRVGEVTYSVGAMRIVPEISRLYKCIVAGTTSSTAPTQETIGATVVDGTCQWIVYGYEGKGLPRLHVPGATTMDGFTSVVDLAGTLRHSEISTPEEWPALNFIDSNLDPDGATKLIKYNHYLLVLGENTYQLFYNAGSPQGSVFIPAEGMSGFIGCPYKGTAVSVGVSVGFVGRDKQGRVGVFLMDGTTPRQVAPSWVLRRLEKLGGPEYTTGGNRALTAGTFTIHGHTFYAIHIPDTNSVLAYDMTENAWVEIESDTVNFRYMSFVMYKGRTLFFDKVNKALLAFSEDGYDISVPRKVSITTDDFDLGMGAIKHMDSLEIDSDRPEDEEAEVTVYYSDDDWLTTSSDIRRLNLHRRDIASRFGAFTKRAFKITYNGSDNIRFKSLRVGIRSSQRLVAGIK
jgi:hypothetical protein